MKQRKRETYEKLEDSQKRQVTYCKRKRGLIKKAIELSKLCDVNVYFCVFDKEKQRLVEFQSDQTLS